MCFMVDSYISCIPKAYQSQLKGISAASQIRINHFSKAYQSLPHWYIIHFSFTQERIIAKKTSPPHFFSQNPSIYRGFTREVFAKQVTQHLP